MLLNFVPLNFQTEIRPRRFQNRFTYIKTYFGDNNSYFIWRRFSSNAAYKESNDR